MYLLESKKQKQKQDLSHLFGHDGFIKNLYNMDFNNILELSIYKILHHFPDGTDVHIHTCIPIDTKNITPPGVSLCWTNDKTYNSIPELCGKGRAKLNVVISKGLSQKDICTLNLNSKTTIVCDIDTKILDNQLHNYNKTDIFGLSWYHNSDIKHATDIHAFLSDINSKISCNSTN